MMSDEIPVLRSAFPHKPLRIFLAPCIDDPAVRNFSVVIVRNILLVYLMNKYLDILRYVKLIMIAHIRCVILKGECRKEIVLHNLFLDIAGDLFINNITAFKSGKCSRIHLGIVGIDIAPSRRILFFQKYFRIKIYDLSADFDYFDQVDMQRIVIYILVKENRIVPFALFVQDETVGFAGNIPCAVLIQHIKFVAYVHFIAVGKIRLLNALQHIYSLVVRYIFGIDNCS